MSGVIRWMVPVLVGMTAGFTISAGLDALGVPWWIWMPLCGAAGFAIGWAWPRRWLS